MAKEVNYGLVLAALVGIVAVAGLIINYSNTPTAAFDWTPPILGPDYYYLGEEVQQVCIEQLTRTEPAYTKNITQADWRECPRDGCVFECKKLGNPDGCVRTCQEGAEQYMERLIASQYE